MWVDGGETPGYLSTDDSRFFDTDLTIRCDIEIDFIEGSGGGGSFNDVVHVGPQVAGSTTTFNIALSFPN